MPPGSSPAQGCRGGGGKDDGRRGVAGGGFFYGRGRSSVVMPDPDRASRAKNPWGRSSVVMPDPDRASRAKNPYFGGVSRVGKAEYVYPGCSLSQG